MMADRDNRDPGPDWRAQLAHEGDGKIEIVVHRAVEVALWVQAIELSHAGFFHQLLAVGPVGDQLRRLAVANAHADDFAAASTTALALAAAKVSRARLGRAMQRCASPRSAGSVGRDPLLFLANFGGGYRGTAERHSASRDYPAMTICVLANI
jgi:hypothetical protein